MSGTAIVMLILVMQEAVYMIRRDTVLLILVVGIVIFLNVRHILKCKFQCKKCGYIFPPSVRQAFFQIHINREYIARCPHCGKLGLCRLLSNRANK